MVKTVPTSGAVSDSLTDGTLVLTPQSENALEALFVPAGETAPAPGYALAGAPRDQAAVIRAVPLYQTHCASCHGIGGEGAEILGTPDLTRGQFRYATDAEGVTLQIWHGTDGRGPMREAARTPSRPKG